MPVANPALAYTFGRARIPVPRIEFIMLKVLDAIDALPATSTPSESTVEHRLPVSSDTAEDLVRSKKADRCSPTSATEDDQDVRRDGLDPWSGVLSCGAIEPSIEQGQPSLRVHFTCTHNREKIVVATLINTRCPRMAVV